MKSPTEQQIIEAAEKAGLWPNSVYHWLPAFHRYHVELAKLQSQAQQPTDLSKQLREYAADSGYSHNDYADTMLAAASGIERLTASQAQQDHIGDSTKLVQAVNALAAQTGESPESITEWLTDKGGLTQLMLSHFGGLQSQAQQESKL